MHVHTGTAAALTSVLCWHGHVVGVATAQRTTVSLDLGWRTRWATPPKGTTGTGCGDDSIYDIAVNGYLGNSGWLVPEATGSWEECQEAACRRNTEAWSYCAAGLSCPPPGATSGIGPWCIIGSAGRISAEGVWPCTGNCSWTTRLRDVTQGPETSASPEVQRDFNDSTWKVVDLPHDSSIELPYRPDADGPQGFQQTVQTWYRKKFRLPADWEEGTAISLVVDGALGASQWWLNGKPLLRNDGKVKTDGYLPTVARLDNRGFNLTFTPISVFDVRGPESDLDNQASASGVNILTVWTDNSATSGWWYEGSGLIRNARLIATPTTASFLPAFAIAAPAVLTSTIDSATSGHAWVPKHGLRANASVYPTAEVVVSAMRSVCIEFSLLDTNNTVIAAGNVTTSVSGGPTATVVAGPARKTMPVLSPAQLYPTKIDSREYLVLPTK
eukprot:INCI9946.2.p1 GENE.INCI9946.2~~INCI9946.2.p1  ORF type:complete len:443 (-),score=38.05 INCI9946.2:2235-3563(-)